MPEVFSWNPSIGKYEVNGQANNSMANSFLLDSYNKRYLLFKSAAEIYRRHAVLICLDHQTQTAYDNPAHNIIYNTALRDIATYIEGEVLHE